MIRHQACRLLQDTREKIDGGCYQTTERMTS